MRALAFLTLAMASMPAAAVEYTPSTTAKAAPVAARPKAATAVLPRHASHRRAISRPVPAAGASGLIITDIRPRLSTSQAYLPPKTDDLEFVETNVAPIKLKKVGFTSMVASVKYHF